MTKFILTRDNDDHSEIKYINIDTIEVVIPEKEFIDRQEYLVSIYTISNDFPIECFISYETAEEIFEHFQFEGDKE